MIYKGQKVTGTDQLRDAASSVIPIGLRNAAVRLPGLSQVGDPDKSLAEEAVSSLGVKTNRASPIIDAHRIAHDWRQRQPGYKVDTGTYPPSQYARLRNALEDKNTVAARRAYQDLLTTSRPEAIAKGLRMSLTKPFTSNRAGDQLMMRQLSADDRQTVKDAQSRRQEILLRFYQLPKSDGSSARDSQLNRIQRFLLGSHYVRFNLPIPARSK